MTIKRANRKTLPVLERQPEPTQPQINIEELTAQITAQVTAQLAEQKQNSPAKQLLNKTISYLQANANTSFFGLGSGGTIAYFGYKQNDVDLIQTGIGIIVSGTAFPDATTIGKILRSLKK